MLISTLVHSDTVAHALSSGVRLNWTIFWNAV